MASSDTANARTALRKVASLHLLLFLVVVASVSPSCLFVEARAGFKSSTRKPFKMPTEDPYNVLRIKHKDRNNMDAIKKAYREMAKAAHPDKNLDLDPTIANQRFHRIQEAWDLLSDERNKRAYDNRSNFQQQHKPRNKKRNVKIMTEKVKPTAQRHKDQQGKHRQDQQRRQHQQEKRQNDERIQKLWREAQDTVQKLSTLEQLVEDGIIDKATQRFSKNFLCVFVSNKKVEKMAEEDYLFPYPFGPKGRNDIDWTKLIWTAKVRFNKATPLTQAFKVPTSLSAPYIVFGRKGWDVKQFQVYNQRRDNFKPYERFEKWVIRMLPTTVTIKNRNPEGGPAIKIFVDDHNSEDNNMFKSNLQPLKAGYQREIHVYPSDRVVILDASTNELFGPGIKSANSLHLTEKVRELTALDNIVVTNEKQEIHVGNGHGNTRTCYDLSTQCHSWVSDVHKNACRDNTEFIHTMCAKSCDVCIDSPYFNGLYYVIMHMPPHKIPPGIRRVLDPLRRFARFSRTVAHDFFHMWEMRRNVTFAFLVCGLLIGVQCVLLARILLTGIIRTNPSASRHEEVTNNTNTSSPVVLLLLMSSTGFVAATLVWFSQATKLEVPLELWGFHEDLLAILKTSVDLVFDLFCLGFASFLLTKILTYRIYRRPSGIRWFHHGLFLASMISSTAIIVFGIGMMKEAQATDLAKISKLSRWKNIWSFRKNGAVVIIGFGQLLGATAMAFIQFAKERTPMRYLFETLLNIGVGCGLLSLTLLDPFFLADFDHVARMRMSAAIPCFVVGVILGLVGAHLWFPVTEAKPWNINQRAKVKID